MADVPRGVSVSAEIPRSGDALQQAMFALDSERPQDAERIAGELLKADPYHRRALHIRGCALVLQGRAAEAVVDLEAAAHGSRDPEIETMLAIALRQAGREEEALSRLKRTTKRSPPYAAAFHELGCLLVSMKRDGEAIDAFRRGIQIAPMMPALSIQLGYVLLGRRNCVDAKSAFARALEIAPGSADALFGMAKAHQQIGENAAAAEYYRRYLMARPEDLGSWVNLGHCLLKLGQLDAGYDCFRTAACGDPKRYGNALRSLVASGRGRFWLKPSAAALFLLGTEKR
jgi:tetratricopeptide (TPR) repeat protein